MVRETSGFSRVEAGAPPQRMLNRWFDRERPALVDGPAECVARPDARGPPHCCRNRHRETLVDGCLVLDVVGQTQLFGLTESVI